MMLQGAHMLLLAQDPDSARVGRAAVRITPPAGIPMAGYYSVRLAEGTHDDLFAKAIVIEQNGAKAAMVACDVVALEQEQIDAARAAIEKITGLRGDQVMISATHSHTGPLLRRRFLAAVEGPPLQISRQYLASLPLKIAESVKLAESDLKPARLWAGIGREESVSFNRRYLMKDGTVGWNPGKLNPKIVQPVGPIDPDVAVAYFDTPDGKPLVTYINFAMHLDTVGGTQFSGDYAYWIAKTLGRIKGPDMLTLFTIGAAGNINHIDVKIRGAQKGQAEAQRIGTILAGEVLKTYARMQPIVTAPPKVLREIVKLEPAAVKPGEVEKARQVVTLFGKSNAPPFLEQVNAFKVLDAGDRGGKPLLGEVQVIAFGNQIAWVGLPGEIFTELGQAVKKASPFPYTIVSELAGGWIGYVPNQKAYAEGAYEVISARCAAGSGEALADAAIRLLAQARQHKTSN
ncbi:MAG: hypothetical protein ABIZ80_18355 [Bryobacteraceae bacterium]